MAKTNFTKVDEALSKALFNMSIQKLLEETEESPNKEPPLEQIHFKMAKTIARKLNFYSKLSKNFYEKIGYPKEELRKLLKNPKDFTEENLKTLEDLVAKITEFKQSENFPEVDDETIISQERTKHINKRFNTDEQWLPLH